MAKEKYFWTKSDAIIVATNDLLEGAPTNAIYLPNLIVSSYSENGTSLNPTRLSIYHME